MEGAKKKEFDESLNVKIQRKFDMVFGSAPAVQEKHSASLDDDFSELAFDGDNSMSDSAKKESSSPKIDLDFGAEGDLEFGLSENEEKVETKKENTGRLSIVPDNGGDEDGLEFNLDFGDDSADIPAVPTSKAAAPAAPTAQEATKSDSHFELDLTGGDEEHEFESRPSSGAESQSTVNTASHDDLGLEMDALFDAEIENASNKVSPKKEGTQPTIVTDKSASGIDLETFSLNENTGSTNSSADLMTTEEAKANIESTIKDIIRPKEFSVSESTQEIDISGLSEEPAVETVPEMDFSVKKSTPESTGEFDLSSVEFADKEEVVVAPPMATSTSMTSAAPKGEPVYQAEPGPVTHYDRTHTSFVSDEESSRFQATIRQLREERDGLLNEIKMLKGETREFEQDNLTLKAALDEAKIEISILRKRHMVEMEDIKYRMAMAEEKRSLAEEKAKNIEARREKLEQRVRIDFNQVKQREKELETKLEILTVDADSQVQSRDQKILELRRKIDSLEFNMENVSIREQKSQEDKRKLEEKLNKIMKTLRHSIKNLEDDIDQVTDEERDDKDKDS